MLYPTRIRRNNVSPGRNFLRVLRRSANALRILAIDTAHARMPKSRPCPLTARPVSLCRIPNIQISAQGGGHDGSQTRFQKAISVAEKMLDGRITIILAAHIPIVVLDKGSKLDAQKVLKSISPTHTPTNLGDAMLSATSILAGEKGKVVVLSDFKNILI